MRLKILVICIPALMYFGSTGVAAQPLIGFTDDNAVTQRMLERQLDSLISADNLRSWMHRMSAKPHHVGSPHAKANAEFMIQLFSEWGYEARLEEFHVLVPMPVMRHVELLEPTRFVARLIEPALQGDATSSIREDRLPPYNAYSADGDVTAELVYVNQGCRATTKSFSGRELTSRERLLSPDMAAPGVV